MLSRLSGIFKSEDRSKLTLDQLILHIKTLSPSEKEVVKNELELDAKTETESTTVTITTKEIVKPSYEYKEEQYKRRTD